MWVRSVLKSCGTCLHKIWDMRWRVSFFCVCCSDYVCILSLVNLLGERDELWCRAFLILSFQSMRSIACVKVQTIWTYTLRWSGYTTSTARSYLLSRNMYQNIQRKSFSMFIHIFVLLIICDANIYQVFVVQLVWAICHHVVGWKWGSVQRFSPWSPGEGQERRGNCFYLLL